MQNALAAPPEIELLLLCVAPNRDERRSVRIRKLLDQPLDWTYLEQLADSHRLLPHLYWELKSARPDLTPHSMEERFQQSTRYSLYLTSQLFRLLDLFERESIDVIPFKGPTLAIAAYNNLALRTFVDLDILVRTEDVWRARDLLVCKGYTTELQLESKRENAYLHSYNDLQLRGPGKSPLIELHWAFVPRYFSVPLKTEPLWARTVSVTMGGHEVPTLHPEDLFLVLCIHGSKHCWSHLGLVCDVAWVVAAHSLRWKLLLERAKELGMHRMVLLASVLISQLLEIPLAEPVISGLNADPAVYVLAAEIVRSLLEKRQKEQTILSASLRHLKMRERLRDRLRYICRLTTRPAVEDWELIDLPTSLSAVYYVLRFPRIALKYWFPR